MKGYIKTCTLSGAAALLVWIFQAQPLEATMPVPVEAVTGCVKNGQMIIQAPERFKRDLPLKITPCVNIPFDFTAAEGEADPREGRDRSVQRRLCLPQGSPDCRRLQAGPG
jgi:hypothetical protein